MPAHNKVIQRSPTTDIQQGALDTEAAMGVFIGANFDSVSQLSLSLRDKEKELQKSKLELETIEQRHEQEINQLKQKLERNSSVVEK